MPELPEHFTYRNSFNLHKLPKRDIYCYCTHLTNEETEANLFFREGQICTAYRLIHGKDCEATPGQLAPLHKHTKARREMNVRA